MQSNQPPSSDKSLDKKPDDSWKGLWDPEDPDWMPEDRAERLDKRLPSFNKENASPEDKSQDQEISEEQ